MVRVKNTKTVKKLRVPRNLNKSKATAKAKSKSRKALRSNRKSKKTRQRGGNPVMIRKLCESSENGKTLGNNVSAGYIGALCSENNEKIANKSQAGGSGNGLVSGVVSNLFKAASFPLRIASGAFNKVTGVDLTEMVSNKVNSVLNHTETTTKPAEHKEVSSDRDSDPALSEFLRKNKL